MNFIRKGPGYLFLRTVKPGKLGDILINKLNGKLMDFQSACEMARENDTIIFITPVTGQKTLVEDAVEIIYLTTNPRITMANIINNEITDFIKNLNIGPGQLVMRIPNGSEKVINKIKENYRAEKVSFLQGINEGESQDTILTLTDSPLRSRLKSFKLIKENLLIFNTVETVYRELRRDAVRYITQGLKDTQWHELKINIYDSSEKYEEQYKRLVNVLRDMEVGFILGESWTRDHAFVLLSVIAYQIKLFTVLDPLEIKKILIGLEYNEEGKRIVDYDLYYNNKKVEWVEILETKRNRKNLGLELRKNIFAQLSASTAKKVKVIEEELERN